MKTVVPLFMCLLMALSATAAETDWEEQIYAMDYLIFHLSGINAINGLNLSRDQAVRLRKMALEIEESGGKIPDYNRVYRPDLAAVRDTYLEVRKYIIDAKEVPDELEKRVKNARMLESDVIRLSIVKPKSRATTNCTACHVQPTFGDVRENRKAVEAALTNSPPSLDQKQTFIGHIQRLFGQKGLHQLKSIAPRVDEVLESGQKAVMQRFACCLTPPKALSDPVRVGQVDGGGKEIEILRAVRKVPADKWPAFKEIILQKVEPIMKAHRPDVTAEQAEAAREKKSEKSTKRPARFPISSSNCKRTPSPPR